MTDVIELISVATTTLDDYGNEVSTHNTKAVLCEVDSITQSEFFAAANTELKPEYKFTVFFGDYNNEPDVWYNGKAYAIYRTYRTGDYMELYAERKIGAYKVLK